jgi:hypothetical protein
MTKFEIPDGKSILILSSPRTGSTWLLNNLHKKYNYKVFNEPSLDKYRLNEFFCWYELGQKFLLKEHTKIFLSQYPKSILENTFTIRISRSNIVGQVLSNYIALANKSFSNTNAIQQDIIMDRQKLKENYNYIQHHNFLTKNLDFHVDMDLLYEELEFENDGSKPSVKPKNYDELKIWATNIINDYEQT